MSMGRRILIPPLIVLMAAASSLTVAAQPEATPAADNAVDQQLTWVLGLFDGGAAALTRDDVEQHFTPEFLNHVPTDDFIATIQQLAQRLGPLKLVQDQSSAAGPDAFSGLFRSASGELVVVSLTIDPDSGRIAGFFVSPARSGNVPAPSAATPGASPVATPVASPVAAGPVVEDPEAQIALYHEMQGQIRAIGEPVVAAVLAGDGAALQPYLTKQVKNALADTPIADVIDSFTARRVQMTFTEASATWFGHWEGDGITGTMLQSGVPSPFTLQADQPQQGDLPTGHWSGTIQQANLDFAVTFGTNADGDLTATLDIPQQNVTDQPLHDVQYHATLQTGDQVDERVFASGVQYAYTADFAWGDQLLRVSVGVDMDAGLASAIQITPAIPTPPPAPDAPQAQATYRAPFQGVWWVFWGGTNQLHNYHAATSSQRYAYDLTIWKDGATFHDDGAENGDYWAWGQPVLAPADGTVIEAVNTAESLPPNAPISVRSASGNPGGNYVVIQTADNEHVFIAHMQQGSVRVDAGDEVEAGDLLGLVGNSGNSSEPHIHIHVQDTPDLLDYGANGIPLHFDSVLVNGEPQRDVMPVQGDFVAPR